LFVNLHKKKGAIYESRGDLSEAYLCYASELREMKRGIFDGITSIIAGPVSIREPVDSVG
jgi:hypothetical protein